MQDFEDYIHENNGLVVGFQDIPPEGQLFYLGQFDCPVLDDITLYIMQGCLKEYHEVDDLLAKVQEILHSFQ